MANSKTVAPKKKADAAKKSAPKKAAASKKPIKLGGVPTQGR